MLAFDNRRDPFKRMLSALRDAIREAVATDQVTDQVGMLIAAIGTSVLGSNDLMKTLGLSYRPTFRENYLNPALAELDRPHPARCASQPDPALSP